MIGTLPFQHAIRRVPLRHAAVLAQARRDVMLPRLLGQVNLCIIHPQRLQQLAIDQRLVALTHPAERKNVVTFPNFFYACPEPVLVKILCFLVVL